LSVRSSGLDDIAEQIFLGEEVGVKGLNPRRIESGVITSP